MSINETAEQRSARLRNGKLALIISVVFWVITIGGIILLIELNK